MFYDSIYQLKTSLLDNYRAKTFHTLALIRFAFFPLITVCMTWLPEV